MPDRLGAKNWVDGLGTRGLAHFGLLKCACPRFWIAQGHCLFSLGPQRTEPPPRFLRAWKCGEEAAPPPKFAAPMARCARMIWATILFLAGALLSGVTAFAGAAAV